MTKYAKIKHKQTGLYKTQTYKKWGTEGHIYKLNNAKSARTQLIRDFKYPEDDIEIVPLVVMTETEFENALDEAWERGDNHGYYVGFSSGSSYNSIEY